MLKGPARFPLTTYVSTVEATGVAVDVPGATTDAGDVERMTGTRLWAPSPNPTAGAVRLGLTLAAPGHVRLVIADATGREVAVVLDGPCSAGDHTVLWNGDVAPGPCLVRLAVDGTPRATRPLTRLR